MVKLELDTNGITQSIDILDDTAEWLHNGCQLRRISLGQCLHRVVDIYGSFTEENINKFMDEYWIL